jgi:hypothetical protein
MSAREQDRKEMPSVTELTAPTGTNESKHIYLYINKNVNVTLFLLG